MTHKKKKMIIRNHKKMSRRGKRITAGAASVLLGTGIMAGARPVKASSRESEYSEVQDVNVLNTEKAETSAHIEQVPVAETSVGSVNMGGTAIQSVNDIDGGGNENIKGNTDPGNVSDISEQDKKMDVVAEDELVNTDDKIIEDYIESSSDVNNDKDTLNSMINTESSFNTTSGSFKVANNSVNRSIISDHNNAIERYDELKIVLEKYAREIEQYKYNKDINEYIEKLIAQGILADDDIENAKKILLEQSLILDEDHAPEISVKVLDEDNVRPISHPDRYDFYIKDDIKGDFLEVIYTYDELNQSTYGGEKISKIVVTYSDWEKGRSNYLEIEKASFGSFRAYNKSVAMTIVIYDSKDKPITLKENTAFVNITATDYNGDVVDGISSRIVSDERNNSRGIGKDNLFNISGDSVKIKFTSDGLSHFRGRVTLVNEGYLYFNKNEIKPIFTLSHQFTRNSKIYFKVKDEGKYKNLSQMTVNMLPTDNDGYPVLELWDWDKEGYVFEALGGVFIAGRSPEYTIYLKHDIEIENDEKDVQVTIQYKNEAGITSAEDENYKLIFNQNSIRDKVNNSLKVQEGWTLMNPEILNMFDSSIVNSLFGDVKLDGSSVTISEEVLEKLLNSESKFTVFRALDPVEDPDKDNSDSDQNTNTSEPDDSSADQEDTSSMDVVTSGQNGSFNSIMSAPENEATLESTETEARDSEDEDGGSTEVFGTYPHQPESDEDETEESVTPHAQENVERSTQSTNGAKVEPIQNAAQDANSAPDAVSTQVAEVETESSTSRHVDEATLPETGEEQSELATIFSMLAAALGITGLAGTSKRRKKDK